MSSSSFSSMACSCSFRRPRRRTSSGLIVLRPACLEKTSRSRAVFAERALALLLSEVSTRKNCSPIWVYTSSVKAPMNCGVAFRSLSSDFSSTNWPIEYQSADLSRCRCQCVPKSLLEIFITSSRSAAASFDAILQYNLDGCNRSSHRNGRGDATRRIERGPTVGPR
jgi:hypothetical protein